MSQGTADQFEERMERLTQIVRALETEDLSLEKGLELFREGMECSRFCRERLEEARIKIETWQKEEEGGQLPDMDSEDENSENPITQIPF